MSEEEIAGLMAEEIAREACETVKGDCKMRCETILRKILAEGKGFELLNELLEESKKAVKEKLRELVAEPTVEPVIGSLDKAKTEPQQTKISKNEMEPPPHRLKKAFRNRHNQQAQTRKNAYRHKPC